MKNIYKIYGINVLHQEKQTLNANRVPLTAHSFNDQADKVIRVATKVIEHFFLSNSRTKQVTLYFHNYIIKSGKVIGSVCTTLQIKIGFK